MRLEIEQRRAEGANGKAERLLEFIGAGGRRAITFREQRLELLPVELGRRYAMAVMIDQRQGQSALNRHRDTSCTWLLASNGRTSRSPCASPRHRTPA